MKKVERTERGWAGHFICAHQCRFRRNTLLVCEDIRVVISSVGLMNHYDPLILQFQKIGANRYYETAAFHAERVQGRYWDANVRRQISFDSEWAVAEVDADDVANDQHDAVVAELSAKLENGQELETFE